MDERQLEKAEVKKAAGYDFIFLNFFLCYLSTSL